MPPFPFIANIDVEEEPSPLIIIRPLVEVDKTTSSPILEGQDIVPTLYPILSPRNEPSGRIAFYWRTK